jgi:antitoxin MazE
MAVQVRIAKWGNSLGVRVPRDVAARVGLTEGSRVDIEASDDGRIIITRSRRRFTLDELVAKMTPEREHASEDDGPRGEEII